MLSFTYVSPDRKSLALVTVLFIAILLGISSISSGVGGYYWDYV